MKPLLELAVQEYPNVSRDELNKSIQILAAALDIKDERYERVVIFMLLRAHYLDKPAAIFAAEALYRIYEDEVSHAIQH